MKGLIRTICGDVRPGSIRYALTHEYAFLAVGELGKRAIERVQPAVERRLVREFRALVKQGFNLFAEVTPMGYRRPVGIWQRACRRTGMHMIATTGYYAEEKLKGLLARSGVERIAAAMVKELTAGIDGTACRAGVIKASAHGYQPLRNERKVFVAAAKAAQQTGAPVTTHCPLGPAAQLALLTGNRWFYSMFSTGRLELI